DGADGHRLLLPQVGRDEIRELIEEAWARVVPRRQATTYAKRRAAEAAQPAITQDVIRQILLSLPDVSEGPIWGQKIGFLVAGEKKRRLAFFGPPVSNLLPPDNENTFVLLACEDRPGLLATSPDRFFITPH